MCEKKTIHSISNNLYYWYPSVCPTNQTNKQPSIHPFYRSSVHLILANLNLNTNESWSSSHASMVGSLTVDCRSNPIQSVTFLHQIISLTLYKKRIIKREMRIRRNKRININFNSIVLTMIIPIFIFYGHANFIMISDQTCFRIGCANSRFMWFPFRWNALCFIRFRCKSLWDSSIFIYVNLTCISSRLNPLTN